MFISNLTLFKGIQWNLSNNPMGLGKSDLNGEVTVLQGDKLHCGIQFGPRKGDPNGELTLLVR